MSTLASGLTDWFRRHYNHDAEEQHSSGITTGGQWDHEPVIIWRASNLMEAQVVKGRLESEDIPAIIQGEALGAIYGLTSGSLAEAVVLVPAPLAEKAEALLYANEMEVLAEEDVLDDTSE